MAGLSATRLRLVPLLKPLQYFRVNPAYPGSPRTFHNSLACTIQSMGASSNSAPTDTADVRRIAVSKTTIGALAFNFYRPGRDAFLAPSCGT